MASNEPIPSIKSKVNPPSDSKTIPKGKESNEMKTESMNMDHDDGSAMIFRIDFTESSDEFKSNLKEKLEEMYPDKDDEIESEDDTESDSSTESASWGVIKQRDVLCVLVLFSMTHFNILFKDTVWYLSQLDAMM